MKINIAATGRFHLCNLAVELEKLGHDIRFYSYVPTSRLQKFGLKKKNSYSFFILMLPIVILKRITRNANWVIKLEWFMMDHLVGIFMKECDVFIAMSAIYEYSFIRAKKRYGAKTYLERGSVHALELKEIYDTHNLERNGSTADYFALTSDYAIARELRTYEITDYISIASTYVRDTFIKHGVDESKLFVNPYGEDLSRFYPTALDQDENYDVIMVGNWSWMKGCDLITEACRKLNLSLLHIGSSAMSFPQDAMFKDIGPVDNREVVNYLKKGKVFVLASRQDGFGVVLIQAFAAGLPLVCSKFNGGETIKNMIDEKEAVQVFDPYDIDSLCKSIQRALDYAGRQHDVRIIDPKFGDLFSSKSYASRYNDFLKR